MKVYVARHAETNYNVLGLCNDSPEVNVYLTGKGIEQAEALANSLKDANFELVITSEFRELKKLRELLTSTIMRPRLRTQELMMS